MSSRRIHRIQVDQKGPLSRSFELEPKSFNLVYGRNESGKTYIVEALIRWLFGIGRGAYFSGKVRGWDPPPTGQVEIIGLHEEDPNKKEVFGPSTRSSEFLQDRLDPQLGLPPDFSKLLVVRAGETLVDSVEDTVAKSLSGTDMLGSVIESIEAVVRNPNTSIGDGVLHGNNAGLIKKHRNLQEETEDLRSLREEFMNSQGLRLEGLDTEIAELNKEQECMQLAKRHHAHKLSQELTALQKEQTRIPPDLNELDESLGDRATKQEAVEVKQAERRANQERLQHLDWAAQALPRFRELTSTPQETVQAKPNQVFLWLFFATFAGAIATGVLGQYLAAGITGASALALLGVHLFLGKKTPASSDPPENPEVEGIRTEYQRRFGQVLVDVTSFDLELKELYELKGQDDQLALDVAALEKELIDLNARLVPRLEELFPDSPPDEWQNAIESLQEKGKAFGEKVTAKQRELDRFGVNEEDFLPDDPGVEWDSEQLERITFQLKKKENELRDAGGKEGELKQKIGNAIGKLNDSWEFLIGELESKLKDKSENYKEVTAELLAKICVNSAANRLQKKEDDVIRKNLEAPEIGETLNLATNGHYSTFDWQSGELSLRSSENELRHIDFLSTGAKEQVMIALRMVFAPRFLGDNPAFLILDDAFQHADWERRKALVKHTLRLVKKHGWQVFYFTMDDNIRDLFQKRAERVFPDDFQFVDLSYSTAS